MSEEHARLGGSTAARWLACAGSIRLSEGMPNERGWPAKEGSVAHHLAHLILAGDVALIDPYAFVGEIYPEVEPDIPVTEDMIAPVMLYVKHVRSLMAVVDEYGIEDKITLEKLSPPEPMYGTADFWGVWRAGRTLYISDLKYGQGVMVEVKGNKQERYYAVGVVLKLGLTPADIDAIQLTIVQPRKDHPEGAIRQERISMTELLEFAEQELMPGAWATQDKNAPLVTGEHCRFCPAQAVCPALAKASMAAAQDEFGFYSEAENTPRPVGLSPAFAAPYGAPLADIIQVPVPIALTNQQIGTILPKLEMIANYIKAVKAHAESEIKAGRPVPGFKVVERRAHREWKDQKEAEQSLIGAEGIAKRTDPIYVPVELKSPAQIEKIVGKKKFKEHLAQHTVKKSSGVVLVPDSDSRESKYLAPGEEFDLLPAVEPTDNKGDIEENE